MEQYVTWFGDTFPGEEDPVTFDNIARAIEAFEATLITPAPYFHSGQVWSLRVAVQVMAESQLGSELSDEDADQIVAFLNSLTGEVPEIVVPVLPAETASTPRPTAEVLVTE